MIYYYLIGARAGCYINPTSHSYRLSAAASSRLEEAKTQGRAGLEHSIGQKKVHVYLRAFVKI